VPLVAEAVEIVSRRLSEPTRMFVFPCGHAYKAKPMVPSSKAARRIHVKADAIMGRPIPNWHLHDLRATLATHLREDVTLPDGSHPALDVVSMLLSHTKPGAEATRVYNRSELLAERRGAPQAWAAWLKKITARKRTRKASVSKLPGAKRSAKATRVRALA
jgi:integrase